MGICSSKTSSSFYYLTPVEYNQTSEFVPPITVGKVIKVYDGDTITIAAKLPYDASPMYRFHVRLAGIDTPELKGHGEAEHTAAVKARDALTSMIYGKMVTLSNTTTEKYGRILADVSVDNLCVNKWMVEQGYAVVYDGGTKKPWNL